MDTYCQQETQQEPKCYVVDYFLHTDSKQPKNMQTFMLFTTSRRSAENYVRGVERNKRLTIVKITFYENRIVNQIFFNSMHA